MQALFPEGFPVQSKLFLNDVSSKYCHCRRRRRRHHHCKQEKNIDNLVRSILFLPDNIINRFFITNYCHVPLL